MFPELACFVISRAFWGPDPCHKAIVDVPLNYPLQGYDNTGQLDGKPEVEDEVQFSDDEQVKICLLTTTPKPCSCAVCNVCS